MTSRLKLTSSAATRRRLIREAQRRRREANRDGVSDDLYGIEWRAYAAGPHASHRGRVAWKVDVDPFEALVGLQRLRTHVLDGFELVLVAECRELGVSWEDIAWALEMTREGARRKYVPRLDAVDQEAGDDG